MYLDLERYSRPGSVEECLRRMAEPGERSAILSGGTDLNVREHEELTQVVDIQALGLDSLRLAEGLLHLGARLTMTRLSRAQALQGPALAALREAARAYPVRALQNRSTLGGRVMVGRSDQDVPPALAALGARLGLCRLDAETGGVREEIVDFPLGADARRSLAGALLVEVLVPTAWRASALRRFARSAVDRPLASCAAALGEEGSLRIVAGVQGPGAEDLRRLPRAEALASSWAGAPPPGWRGELRPLLVEELAAHGDAYASGEYRRDLAATLGLRAVAAVLGEEEVV